MENELGARVVENWLEITKTITVSIHCTYELVSSLAWNEGEGFLLYFMILILTFIPQKYKFSFC